MCGIAGICKWTPFPPAPWSAGDRSSLQPMQKAIAHRGPDGSGIYTDPRLTHTVALLHARLAIIDLPTGQQPMANETNDVQVVFNGEIYNHLQLRAELEKAGHRFHTDHSDTEVLVHGWEQWGTDLPAKLLGMFAFAIWDAHKRRHPLPLPRPPRPKALVLRHLRRRPRLRQHHPRHPRLARSPPPHPHGTDRPLPASWLFPRPPNHLARHKPRPPWRLGPHPKRPRRRRRLLDPRRKKPGHQSQTLAQPNHRSRLLPTHRRRPHRLLPLGRHRFLHHGRRHARPSKKARRQLHNHRLRRL